jgi:hypothetical protein
MRGGPRVENGVFQRQARARCVEQHAGDDVEYAKNDHLCDIYAQYADRLGGMSVLHGQSPAKHAQHGASIVDQCAKWLRKAAYLIEKYASPDG